MLKTTILKCAAMFLALWAVHMKERLILNLSTKFLRLSLRWDVTKFL